MVAPNDICNRIVYLHAETIDIHYQQLITSHSDMILPLEISILNRAVLNDVDEVGHAMTRDWTLTVLKAAEDPSIPRFPQ
jgi:hypothetical protein